MIVPALSIASAADGPKKPNVQPADHAQAGICFEVSTRVVVQVVPPLVDLLTLM